MQKSKLFFNISMIVLAAILIILLVIFSFLIFFDNKVNDEDVYASQTYVVSDKTGGYDGDVAYTYLYYDNTYISSASVTAPVIYGSYTETDDEGVPWEITEYKWAGSFTLTPKSGYSGWSSSAPSQFTVYYGTSYQLSTAKTNADKKSSSIKVNRSGSTFTAASTLYRDSTSYFVLIIDSFSSSYFTPNNYTLYFDYNGGSGSVSSRTQAYNSSIGTLPTGTRSMYSLSGWKIGSTTISSSTTYSWLSNQTAVAQWTFSGSTLTYSVSPTGGGSIAGVNTTYATGSEFTATASPNDGYIFDYWLYNNNKFTANPITLTISADSTLVAYFKEIANVTVSIVEGAGTIEKDVDGDNINVLIRPSSGLVYQIAIDDVVYPIEYYKANIWKSGSAREISYYVKDTTSTFLLYFEYLFESSDVKIYIGSRSATLKEPPIGGASIEGVGILSTNGGEARINGFDTSNENSIVHISALAYAGYTFIGWTASDGTDLSAYGMSADIPYNVIKGKVLTANFATQISDKTNEQVGEDSSGVI